MVVCHTINDVQQISIDIKYRRFGCIDTHRNGFLFHWKCQLKMWEKEERQRKMKME